MQSKSRKSGRTALSATFSRCSACLIVATTSSTGQVVESILYPYGRTRAAELRVSQRTVAQLPAPLFHSPVLVLHSEMQRQSWCSSRRGLVSVRAVPVDAFQHERVAQSRRSTVPRYPHDIGVPD